MRDILAMRPGGVPIPLVTTEYAEQGPAISPDGGWLAYTSDETGRNEVFVRPFPDVGGAKLRVSTGGGIKPLWAHSGRELFFVDISNRMIAAEIATAPRLEVIGRETLFTIPASYLVGPNADFFDITSDDQRFLMARQYEDDSAEAVTLTFILVNNFFEQLKAKVGN